MKINIYKTVPFIIVIGIWEILSLVITGFQFKFSSPSDVFNTFYLQLTDAKLIDRYNIYYSFWLTLSETFLGFLIGNILGTLLGMLMWFSQNISRITKPFIMAISAIPIFALAPVLILWFGTGFSSKVIMAAFSVFIVAIYQAFEGAQNVSQDHLNYFKSLNASRTQILLKLIIPSSLVWVFNSYRLNVGFAIIGAFIGEWISSQYGIGHIILAASGLYNVALIFVGIICLMLISFIMNTILGFLENRFLIRKS